MLESGAALRSRVRLRGTVVDRGYGHSGRYTAAVLRLLTPAGSAMWNFIVTKGNSFLPRPFIEPGSAKPLEV